MAAVPPTAALDGQETLRYDKLPLATGSRVRRFSVPGSDLPDVRYLRTLPESGAQRSGSGKAVAGRDP